MCRPADRSGYYYYTKCFQKCYLPKAQVSLMWDKMMIIYENIRVCPGPWYSQGKWVPHSHKGVRPVPLLVSGPCLSPFPMWTEKRESPRDKEKAQGGWASSLPSWMKILRKAANAEVRISPESHHLPFPWYPLSSHHDHPSVLLQWPPD